MGKPVQTVMIFRWKGELPTEADEPDPERLTRLLSLEPGKAVLRSLQSLGFKSATEMPCGAYDGWDIDLEIEGGDFTLFVHWWTPLGNELDWFAIRTCRPRGCLGSLFSRQARPERLGPVVEAVRRATQAIDRIEDVHWLTHEGFLEYYAEGKEFDL